MDPIDLIRARRRRLARAAALVGATAMLGASALAAPVAVADTVITVNTVSQEINGDGFCSLQEAIYAANLSGDADTVGAIACAIAGTFKGIGVIEASILLQLDADEVFAGYKVREIAAGLFSLINKD